MAIETINIGTLELLLEHLIRINYTINYRQRG